MNNDEWFADENNEREAEEAGSDELLSDEQLRLPESASILVRLHAVRAWLERRRQETSIEEGEAALALQEALTAPSLTTAQEQVFRPRRRRDREQATQEEQLQRLQQAMLMAQRRRSAYEEAQTLLEECVTHTSGERVLVEYYLALGDLIQAYLQAQQETGQEMSGRRPAPLLPTYGRVLSSIEVGRGGAGLRPGSTPWLQAMADVQHRIEQVGIRENEED